MTPAARYQASIELWGKICDARIPMDAVCGDYFRRRRFIGSKDRAEVAARAYDMMRSYARLGWWCDKLKLEDNARSRVLLSAVLVDGKNLEDLQNLFNGNKYHPDDLSDIEKDAINNGSTYDLTNPDMPLDVRSECPLWAFERLQKIYGDEYDGEMSAMLHPATLDVRVNTILIDLENAKNSLSKDGVESDKTPYSPVGLRLKSKAFLSKTKVFRKGMIEIQDEGSQLLALICGAKPGMQVLDYCAGGGGKTLALAASMEGKGRVVAMDIDERRLAKSKSRLTRADVHNVELRPIKEEKHKKWFRRQKEKFDVVLIDAPCSSSGTWRRNPDLRWHHFGPTHETIQQSQTDILANVWQVVKIGGRLIYATCSLFEEENEMQVQKFLDENPNFKLVSAPKAWTDAGLEAPCPVSGDYLRLSPKKQKTDGFFAAVMERVSE